ncbi:MarR family winged helix-turn-helix transcriptional regulator, partial [Nostocoides japonicum]|uniref:MarR family winged helix-turn-helix transcriptional regulator n=1 Tax=Nostocoides japonicum TaxID=99481 RepID=UPI00065B5FF7
MQDADTDTLVSALLTASRALVGVSVRSLGDVEDTVTPIQFRTMIVLSAHGDSSLVALAGLLGVNPSTAQRQVDRLVGMRLVERAENPGNRREVRLVLSRRGAGLVARVMRRRREAITRIVEAMPRSELGALVTALEAFSAAAG